MDEAESFADIRVMRKRTEYEARQRAFETEWLLHEHSRAPRTDRHTVRSSDVGKSSAFECVDGVPQMLWRLKIRVLLPANITQEFPPICSLYPGCETKILRQV